MMKKNKSGRTGDDCKDMMKKNKSGRIGDEGKDISNNPNPNISLLGDELIVYEILSRLSVKSLMRFKCVCKSWGSLIHDDPYFVDLHLSQSNTRPRLLITAPIDNGGICLFSVDLFQGRTTVVHKKKMNSWVELHELKSVDGLICFVHKEGIRVYNLSTQKATPLIKTTRTEKEQEQEERRVINNVHHHQKMRLFESYGFGFDPATKEHKVLCIWKIFGIQEGPVMVIDLVCCEVMTVGDNTWRRIDELPPYYLHEASVYVNGAIYWWSNNTLSPPSPSAKVIVAFDVGSEKFRVIPIPNFIAPSANSFTLDLLNGWTCSSIR